MDYEEEARLAREAAKRAREAEQRRIEEMWRREEERQLLRLKEKEAKAERKRQREEELRLAEEEAKRAKAEKRKAKAEEGKRDKMGSGARQYGGPLAGQPQQRHGAELPLIDNSSDMLAWDEALRQLQQMTDVGSATAGGVSPGHWGPSNSSTWTPPSGPPLASNTNPRGGWELMGQQPQWVFPSEKLGPGHIGSKVGPFASAGDRSSLPVGGGTIGAASWSAAAAAGWQQQPHRGGDMAAPVVAALAAATAVKPRAGGRDAVDFCGGNLIDSDNSSGWQGVSDSEDAEALKEAASKVSSDHL